MREKERDVRDLKSRERRVEKTFGCKVGEEMFDEKGEERRRIDDLFGRKTGLEIRKR